ncbi:MAG: hypothetical protein JO019_03370 [Candidatus Kaiserbacteria bacterium]|nr:hypothetical protein [Candidatus Kaiserbacteria bacterium]
MELDHNSKTFVTFLLAGMLLLAVGEVYIIFGGPSRSSAISTAGTVAGAASSSAPTAATYAPSSVLLPVGGQVDHVDGSTIVIKDSGTGRPARLDASNASVVRFGNLKDPTTREAEMNAFHEHSNELMRDPIKNHDELQRLVAPSIYVEQQLSVSDIAAGDFVTALTEKQNSDGSFVVDKIVVSAPPASSAAAQ